MPRVLLTHTSHMLENYYGDRALAKLQEICEVRFNETGDVLDCDALVDLARGCDIVLSDRQTPGYGSFFDAAPDVAAFLRCAVDIRTVDVEAANRNGVLVTRATPGFATSVAEMALGFMIDLARGISQSVTTYRGGRLPEERRGRTLAGASVGIIGYGVIGMRLAELARCLGMKVLVSDPHKEITQDWLTQVSLEVLIAEADFVVCLAPATPETVNLMNARVFASMRRDGYFINLSRGELVDEQALEAALVDGKIAGAALDVGLAPDQMPNPRLAARSDVLATPHVAGLTPAAVEHQAFDTVEQVRALVEGRIPEHAVNAKDATRLERFGIFPGGK